MKDTLFSKRLFMRRNQKKKERSPIRNFESNLDDELCLEADALEFTIIQ